MLDDYQQGYYDGVSKCREIISATVNKSAWEYKSWKELLQEIDALLHPPPDLARHPDDLNR